MRVLVISLNAWNLTNSTGNTLSNLFSKLSKEDAVANIYCRDEEINNTICKRYFRVTEKDIVFNLFSPQRCGHTIFFDGNESQSKRYQDVKHNDLDWLKKFRSTFFLLIREIIWSIPVWQNRKLKEFILDFDPGIIYMHGHYNIYMHKLLCFCQKISSAKVAMYWGDDMYGRKSKAPVRFCYESLMRKSFRESIDLSSLLFGGSLQLCEEYSKIFNKPFIPFFKECKQIKYEIDKGTSNPITIVYAGNLLFGREEIVTHFVKALSRVNVKEKSRQFRLKIYSNTIPSVKSLCILDDKINSFFLGRRSYLEVCEEMDKSDLALFIESFNKKNILSTRLSFSTKIIDCMQSSAGILAVGPSEIASMKYLIENKLGFTITSIAEMEDRLGYLADHPQLINIMNKNKVEFATKYHINTSEHALAELRRLV